MKKHAFSIIIIIHLKKILSERNNLINDDTFKKMNAPYVTIVMRFKFLRYILYIFSVSLIFCRNNFHLLITCPAGTGRNIDVGATSN